MRVGIYGGSFSPPHAGHVRLAETFLREMRLDRLIVMPAGIPPHKELDGGADAEARYEMCRIAFGGISDRVEISDYEVLRREPCYTVDTLRRFSGEGELFMLCGSDMFLTLEQWREPEKIFALCTVVCGTRVAEARNAEALDGANEKYRRKYGASTVIMDFEPIEVSSTEIRDSLLLGAKPDCICDGVFELIRSRGLYDWGKGKANE